ncbi:MAG TPA: hypothetical protein VMW73_13490 [Spirochaetia bacterium]|nr:hypothetical protein [Spirochaetia bacterium]
MAVFPPDFGWMIFPFVLFGLSALSRLYRSRKTEGEPPAPTARIDERVPGEAAIYRLAQDHGGRLTVSELVVGFGISGAQAEATMQTLTDGARVRMEVSDTGVVWYEFTEILSRFESEKEKQNGD